MSQQRGSTSPAQTQSPVEEVLDPRHHLAAIVDASHDPIVSTDLNDRILSWNPAAERIFGYTAEEMVGRPASRLLPPDRSREEDEIFANLRRGQGVDHFETMRLRKDGGQVPMVMTISPIRDDSGRVIGASKILRDISQNRENRESRFRLAAIVDSAEDAIISKDLQGMVQTWNEGARRTFGYTAEEMIGQPIQRLIPEDMQHEEEEILTRIRRGERLEHYETIRTRKEGTRIYVSETISPIHDETGRIVGASKIARDISDRKRLERLLIDAEKLAANGRMAASIAHEINNPLESLMNLIYLARQTCAQDSKAVQYLLTAEDELERVSQIARQTLGYYRDTGKPTELHLHELLQNVLTVYQSKLVSSNISTDARFEDDRKILVRKGEMLQVFSNIIANAIDAMPRGGRLTLTTRTARRGEAEGVEVKLADTGTGIPAEQLERIFEPFFTTKGEIGTGVGLWVARQLISKRGGDISVSSSVEPGRSGTEVTIFLPFQQSDTSATAR